MFFDSLRRTAIGTAMLCLCACGGGSGGESAAPAPVGPDIVASLSIQRSIALPNQENTLTVTVRNAGAASAVGTVLNVPPTAGFSYETITCAGSGGVVCPAGTVQVLAAGLTLPSIPTGGALTFTIDGVVTAVAGSSITFSANATLVEDGVPSNNAVQRLVAVNAPLGSTLVTEVPPAIYPNNSDELVAFTWINNERSRCGMGKLAQVGSLDQSAIDHVRYLATNLDNGNLTELTHVQNPSHPSYTGTFPSDRARLRGYSALAAELAAADALVLSGYQGLFGDATFHSLIAQDSYAEVGLGSGFSQRINSWLSVITLGNAKVQLVAQDSVVTYPCGGETLLWRNHSPESPSPLPNVSLVTQGPPITIMVRDGQELKVREVTLTTQAGEHIGGTLLTNEGRTDNRIKRNQAAFIPNKVLPAHTTFNATIRGTNEGQRFEKRFSFSTGI